MDKLKSVLSGEEARRDDRTVLETVNEASTLGWGTRVKGFIACFVIGGVCTILGVCMLFLPKIGVTLFIVFYTFGNVCTLGSTMFLLGPMKQLKRMCDKTRALATTIMITCLVLTLCAAFWFIPSANMKGDGLMTYTAASQQGAIKMFRLHFWGSVMMSIFWKNFGLALLFVILQILSFTWYSLSYIPFVRDAILKLLSLCFKSG